MRRTALALTVLFSTCMASAQYLSLEEGYARTGRSLKSVNTTTLQVGMASLVDPGSKIQVCKVDVTKRSSCGDLLGNPLPCPVSPGYRGVVNYTVAQGDTLNVNFNTNSSKTVIMGGSKNGGFAEDAPCQVAGHLGTAPSQPIAQNTITGFTFSPTRAVCPSFVNNTQGQLSVYVFDTSDGSVNATASPDYLASACRFTINLFIQKAADAPIKDSQLYFGNAQQSLG